MHRASSDDNFHTAGDEERTGAAILTDSPYRDSSRLRRLPGRSLDDTALPSPIGSRQTIQPPIMIPSSLLRATTTGGTSRLPRKRRSRIYDDPIMTEGYREVPLMDILRLPRGGISMETKSVGRVQFGILPETIKDSMRLGLDVPRVYIVPAERFCREMGPALGINLAEFEFPAYFNWFIRRKRCVLVVDSDDAEMNIRSVFEETLLGPKQFRDDSSPKQFEEEDFDPSFPHDKRPNFYEEFKYFRIPDKENPDSALTTDMLLEFCHYEATAASTETTVSTIGTPPTPAGLTDELDEHHSSYPYFGESAALRESALRSSLRSSGRIASATELRALEEEALWQSSDDISQAGSDPTKPDGSRRGSADSFSLDSLCGFGGSTASPSSRNVDEERQRKHWMYSQAKWLGEVATVWPMDATPSQIEERSVPRLEIFRMPGGAEYIIHDVDENNKIIGKARFSGTVRVPDEIAVEGFVASDRSPPNEMSSSPGELSLPLHPPCSFHPPSFGVTVLGNSHGFDKNGSTSGYVLWINGRGVMIDPPPYSSATLEREGIRPQVIIGVIITHCHADHDAGAFQKVLTGSRVSIITTPSIYKSFIRKYAALSGLRPDLLRHSHRFRPAIIGQPLRFQGATFHFTYSLHTIPCIGFKAKWRGKSIVFTGDHLNSPPVLDELQQSGVLSAGRADDLRHLPIQDCDVLLHEAGAPPIHTPLSVLEELPERIKQRLYVVHTAALPEDSSLRVASTGTAGTIRLDQTVDSPLPDQRDPAWDLGSVDQEDPVNGHGRPGNGATAYLPMPHIDPSSLDDGGNRNLSVVGDYTAPSAGELHSIRFDPQRGPPLVFLRPTDISDAWFILNLLSNVPFFSSLSYLNSMEVLEIAQVKVFCAGTTIIPASRRPKFLCVVWEGTCVEREHEEHGASENDGERLSVLHAGDWTGPAALQPDGDPPGCRDLVAVSNEGVKAILIQWNELEKVLNRESKQYRKYLKLQQKYAAAEAARIAGSRDDKAEPRRQSSTRARFEHVLEVLKSNSVLRNLSAVQKRSLEAIAEGPRVFEAGSSLWQAGDPCDYGFLVVSGTATFGQIYHAAGSARSKFEHHHRSSSRGNIIEIGGGRYLEVDKHMKNVAPDGEFARLEMLLALRAERIVADIEDRDSGDLLPREQRAHNARDRFANKTLSQMYASRKYTTGLVFSRGSFLCDTSRMVSGELVHEFPDADLQLENHCHSSNMMAGPDGCVAIVFPRSSLVPFLDASPGVLLSLLGTQVVL